MIFQCIKDHGESASVLRVRLSEIINIQYQIYPQKSSFVYRGTSSDFQFSCWHVPSMFHLPQKLLDMKTSNTPQVWLFSGSDSRAYSKVLVFTKSEIISRSLHKPRDHKKTGNARPGPTWRHLRGASREFVVARNLSENSLHK